MSKRTGPTNPVTLALVAELKKLSRKEKAKIWNDIAHRLSKSTRIRSEVNVSKIENHLKKDETAIIPGKLLGNGEVTKPIIVAAFKASSSAKEKIKAAKGQFLTIHELAKKNPKGKNVRIIQ